MNKTQAKLDHNEQEQELDALKDMDDAAIDYADIPPTTPEQWQGARMGAFYRPKNPALTVRIDEDVVTWLKTRGQDHPSRVNDLLRQMMLRDTRQAG
jgi:uncharacterized protein (DUF4415 family)